MSTSLDQTLTKIFLGNSLIANTGWNAVSASLQKLVTTLFEAIPWYKSRGETVFSILLGSCLRNFSTQFLNRKYGVKPCFPSFLEVAYETFRRNSLIENTGWNRVFHLSWKLLKTSTSIISTKNFPYRNLPPPNRFALFANYGMLLSGTFFPRCPVAMSGSPLWGRFFASERVPVKAKTTLPPALWCQIRVPL